VIELDDHGSFSRFVQSLRAAAGRIEPAVSDGAAESLKGVGQTVERRAASILPQRGGLARRVSAMTVRVTRKGKTTSLEVRSDVNLDQLDRGSVVHPVYGRRPLVRQSVPPGFWTKVTEESKPRIEMAMQQALDRVIREIN